MQKDVAISLPTSPASRRGWGMADVWLLVVVFLWGMNFIALKWAMVGLPAVVVAASRVLIAVPLLWAIVWRQGRLERPTPAHRRSLWAAGMLFGLVQITFLIGLNGTTAANGSLLSATTPIFVALLAPLTGAEGVGRRGWTGILLTFVGIALVIGQLQRGSLTGDLITLISAAGWGFYMLLIRPLLACHSPALVTAYAISVAGLMQLPLALPWIWRAQWPHLTPLMWAGLIHTSALSLGIGNVLWNRSMREIGPARAAVYTSLTPLVAATASAFLLAERLTWGQVIGAAIILGGLYTVQSERFR